jgi:HK97 family phage major capsid protein
MRSEDLRNLVNKAYDDYAAGHIDSTEFHQICDKAENDLVGAKNRRRANQFVDPREISRTKAMGGAVSRNVSPMDIPESELVNMFEAAKRKMPYRAEISTKAFGDGSLTNVQTKTTGAPITEGAQWPSGLFPPVLRPELTQQLRFEFDRMADHIPTLTIDAPSTEYLVHTGNTNPAGVVAELGVKPDLGMQLDTQTAVPVKLAALASTSMEALQDFEYFSSWVPLELSRAVTNVETQQLVLGTGASGGFPGMTGFVNTSGVLTRAYNGSTDVSGLDTLIQACNDIRVGSAFGSASLIALHPSTWDFLKRTKTTTDAFVLAVMDPTSIGSLDNLFGVKVITNTFIPEGTGVVLDTGLAAKYFVRQALTIDMNLWGDTQWTTNQISFRAEMRSTLAVLRPTAICVVTGLQSDAMAS